MTPPPLLPAEDLGSSLLAPVSWAGGMLCTVVGEQTTAKTAPSSQDGGTIDPLTTFGGIHAVSCRPSTC